MIIRVLSKCKYHHHLSSPLFARCSFSRCSILPSKQKGVKHAEETPLIFKPSHDIPELDQLPRQVALHVIPSGKDAPIRPSINVNQLAPKTVLQSKFGYENELIWKNRDVPSYSDYTVYWLRLSKYRLTGLVVATTLAGFTMGCDSMSGSLPLLASTLAGTALTSSSAAALNQYLEIPFDSQMARTRSRPLVVGQITPLHAFIFASVTGTAGLSLLALNVNAITAVLGAANLILYSFIYTPMKRSNILNTWIGSFVGAIPPVMGFTAATGMIDASGLLLGLILYSWQFPHFNALSWNLRHDYARAGYRMMSVTNPGLCLRTQFRHSLYLTAYCLALSAPGIDLTSWIFAVDTLPFNLYLIYLSYKFKTDPSATSSRKLFRYSLVHLPVIILLMVLSKTIRTENHENKTKDLIVPSVNLVER